MTIAYFDCFAGAGGDMIVGSLLDAGLKLGDLEAKLRGLGLAGYSLRATSVQRNGMTGTKFDVDVDDPPPGHHEHSARHLGEILEMIDQADLSSRPTQQATKIFQRLAEAEAQVHGIEPEKVHFHEVGAVDSIVDIVSACVGLDLMGIDRILCSAIPVGRGTLTCAHGTMPAPAPATARLLVGAKVIAAETEGEVTTPTAAAVLTTLTEGYGPIPPISVSALGYGAGARQNEVLPNLLRVFIGQPDAAGERDTVVELSANIDDCTGEMLGATIQKLLAAGCLDAWATPIYMKKSRPAWTLSALALEANADQAEELIFSEATTFGIRRRLAHRSKLLRKQTTVETPYGPISVKTGSRAGQEITASPEFAECQAAAEAHHTSAREVVQAAMAAYREGHTK